MSSTINAQNCVSTGRFDTPGNHASCPRGPTAPTQEPQYRNDLPITFSGSRMAQTFSGNGFPSIGGRLRVTHAARRLIARLSPKTQRLQHRLKSLHSTSEHAVPRRAHSMCAPPWLKKHKCARHSTPATTPHGSRKGCVPGMHSVTRCSSTARRHLGAASGRPTGALTSEHKSS